MYKQLLIILFFLMSSVLSAQNFQIQLDSLSIHQNALQTNYFPVFIGALTGPSVRSCDAIYQDGRVVALIQARGADVLHGVIPNDSTVAVFSQTQSSFLLFRQQDLVLTRIYPVGSEIPSDPNRSIDFHSIATSPSGKIAVVYKYDSTVTQFGDSTGTFRVPAEDVVITDTSHAVVCTATLAHLFPPNIWNLARAYNGNPFHENALQFEDDTTLLISMRSLGLASLNVKDSARVNWFIPEDSFTSWPIWQHALRIVSNRVYSCYSDGDTTHPPLGVVFRIDSSGVSLIHTFTPLDSTARSSDQGSYSYSDSLELLNSGMSYTLNQPQLGLWTQTIAKSDSTTVFNLRINNCAGFNSWFTNNRWHIAASASLFADSVMLNASHTVTGQVPVWYSFPDFHPLATGDSITMAFNQLPDSVFYAVPANDTNWIFESDIIVKQSITDIARVNAPNKLSVFPNPAQNFVQVTGLRVTDAIEVFNSLGQNIRVKTTSDGLMDVSPLTQGVYEIVVKRPEGPATQKIVICR